MEEDAMELGDDFELTGRSLSELSIGRSTFLNCFAAANEGSYGGEPDSEFVLDLPSRTGSELRTDSLNPERNEDRHQALRPYAAQSALEVVRAVKRKLESEPPSRSGSQQLEDLDCYLQQDGTLDAPTEYAEIDESESTAESAIVPTPEELIPGLAEQAVDDIFKDIKVVSTSGASGSKLLIRPTTEQARTLVRYWYDTIRFMEQEYLDEVARQNSVQPAFSLSDCRTESNRPYPEPTDFKESRISAGTCRVFSFLTPVQPPLIDVRLFAERCPRGRISIPWQDSNGQYQLDCEITNAAASNDLNGRSAVASDGTDKVCKVDIKLPNGDDKVILRVWRDGKTQVNGCSSTDAVLQANMVLHNAILQIPRQPYGDQVLRVTDADFMAAEQRIDVEFGKAAIMGGWDCGFEKVQAKLNMDLLCDFLTKRHKDLIESAKKVGKNDGAGARFKQIGINVWKHRLDSCADELSDKKPTIYVNLYESGKCTVLGISSVKVGQELARRVTAVLIEAFSDDNLRQPTQPKPTKARRQ